MKEVNVRKIGNYIVVVASALLLFGCTSKELKIKIELGKSFDMFYFIDEEGKIMTDFGGLARSIEGLKINGKKVYRAIIIDMMDAHHQKGIYFAFSEEQMPKKTVRKNFITGQEFVETTYDGGTTLVAGPKFKYKKGINSLNIIVK